MPWDPLSDRDLIAFLDQVKDGAPGVLFTPHTCQGKRLRLPFYSDIFLYRLTHFASMPVLTLHYLSNGSRFFYLDGTTIPLSIAHTMSPLRLTIGNVLSYLQFYFFAVAQEAGEMFLVHDTDTYPFHDMGDFDLAPAITIGQDNPHQVVEENDGGFVVDTPIMSDGTLTRARLRIDPNGAVHILAQHIMVGGATQPYTTVPR